MAIKLVKIPLEEKDLLFYESFIKRLGGPKKARLALMDIIDRYFHTEYIDWEVVGKKIPVTRLAKERR